MKLNKLLSESALVFLGQVIYFIFPMLLIAHLLDVLGKHIYGSYAFYMSIISLIVLFQNLGITSYGISLISGKNQDKLIESAYRHVTIFRIITFTTIFVFVSMSLLIYNEYKWLFLLVIPLLNIFSIDWIYAAYLKAGVFVKIQVANSLFFFLLIYFMVNSNKDLDILIALTVVQNITLLVLSYFYMPCGIHFIKIKEKITINEVVNIFKESLPFVGYSFFDTMRTNSGGFILGITLGAYYSGYWSICEKFIQTASSATVVINRVLFPFVKRYNDFNVLKKIIYLAFLIVFLSYIPAFYLSGFISDFFFSEANSVEKNYIFLFIVASSLVLLNSLLGLPVYAFTNEEKNIWKSSFASIIFYVILLLTWSLNDMKFDIFLYMFIVSFLPSIILRFLYFLKIIRMESDKFNGKKR